ncbi:SseB family protein [Streptacidiphilus jiangxiensis]|uniref:SseB protein N-terminal domain-containing protein n=1 Tax=Streptacidiphilus jiangxiensis TaxID=235985 RepID=A0A1H7XKG9_STRJI|nr:SseB family protein [Streptacidiphilus jiangxiensis]SEM34422.1 SseB protein N-terminal domain-containing protein [Streptacidiphilus jiangxiensis]
MERKNIPDPGFAGDDGSADPRLAAALAAYAAEPVQENEERVLALLATARLMVPIVAVLGEVETDANGLRHEKTSDMAVPTIQAPDGRKGLPAFTSLESLAAWRADARPAPVPASQAVQAAWSEHAEALLIDLAGPVFFELSGAAMRAVAESRAHVAALRDPAVADELRAILGKHAVVLRAHLLASEQADGQLVLIVAPDTKPDALQAVAASLTESELLRIRLDRGLDLAVVAPGGNEPTNAFYART